jgi:hypothetical protein
MVEYALDKSAPSVTQHTPKRTRRFQKRGLVKRPTAIEYAADSDDPDGIVYHIDGSREMEDDDDPDGIIYHTSIGRRVQDDDDDDVVEA